MTRFTIPTRAKFIITRGIYDGKKTVTEQQTQILEVDPKTQEPIHPVEWINK